MGIKKAIVKSFIMPDCYFIALAKSKESFLLDRPIKFLEPWHEVDKHAKEILIYLQKNNSLFDNNPHLNIQSKAK